MKKSKAGPKIQSSPMTNAQQQLLANSLQPPIQQLPVQQVPVQQVPVQQVPVQQFPVQQQMQYPIQLSMPQPGVSIPTQQVPVNRLGYYGNRVNVQRVQQTQQEQPAIFNDD